ncbi:MAG TPA: hypothetical protein VN845_03770 [Solirubrobacteraceae bacterium]|nr:hypothetical protein [Solirubrobacteraceae bacterium]
MTIPATLVVLLGALLFSSAPALAVVRHEYLSQLTGFQDPVALTVDSSSDLYVVDAGSKTVDRFDSSYAPLPFSASEAYVEGSKLTGTPTGPGGSVVPFENPQSVAVDDATGEVYVADPAQNVVDVFNSNGEYLSQLTGVPAGPFNNPVKLAVDQTTEKLYVLNANNEGYIAIFDAATDAYLSQFKISVWPQGNIAIDEFNEGIYLAKTEVNPVVYERDLKVIQILGETGNLLQPEFLGKATQVGSFGRESVGSPVYVGLDEADGHSFVADQEDDVVDEFGNATTEEVYEGQLTGTSSGAFTDLQAVTVNSSNGDVLVADASGAVDVFGPDIQVAPIIEKVTFSNVDGNAAKLGARVITGAAPATYHVEYGTTSAYGSSTPSTPGSGSQFVSVEVGGLTPNTEYHARVVAEDKAGATFGEDFVFRTLPVPTGSLPDDRVYEMVTPVDKEDSEVYVPIVETIVNFGENYGTLHPFQVASDGNAVVYEGDPTHNGGGESTGNGIGSAYLATRSPDGGWSQASIQSPGRKHTYYLGFSSNLSIGVLESATEVPNYEEPPLPGAKAPGYLCGPKATRETECQLSDLYKHTLGEENYQSLYSARPIREPKELNGVVPSWGLGLQSSATYAGASLDMSHLLLEADDALLEGGGALEAELDEDVRDEIAEGRANYDYLYDSSDGTPALVDVSPDGRVVRNATFGAPHARGLSSEANPSNFSHVISNDGSRVFWTALEGTRPKALYVRENPAEPQSPLDAQGQCTVPTDACTIQIDAEVGGEGRFWTASSDGSKVLFTSKAGELYEYQLNPVVGEPGVLSDLTPGVEVQGVLGASEDDAYVYYVDSAGELHMLHYDGSGWEAPTSIATLSEEDGDEVQPMSGYKSNTLGPQVGDWVADLGQRTAEVSVDGKSLAFVSNQSLKAQGFPDGYKNEHQEEVYVYDASSKTLFCASCSQSDEAGSSGFLPVSWRDTYIPTLVSEDGGRVFFDSVSALVSRDTNGKQDVYEWEREGVGSCREGQGAKGGCISLLSSGASVDPSSLLGASVNGSDVFVITRSNLTPDAGDELFKVFDARADGVVAPTPSACTGTGCQGIPAPGPIFATPASVTFAGVGNFSSAAPVPAVKVKSKPLTRAQKLARALKLCRGRPKKQRASCKTQAKRLYGTKGNAKRSASQKKGRK